MCACTSLRSNREIGSSLKLALVILKSLDKNVCCAVLANDNGPSQLACDATAGRSAGYQIM